MGVRYFLNIKCRKCGKENYDIYYAPTCDFISYKCNFCGAANEIQRGLQDGGNKVMRGSILDEAKAVINGDREDSYGNPEDSFSRIAELWTAYLKPWTTDNDLQLTGKDVAMMMAFLKAARWEVTGDRDSIVDMAGYIGLAGDM